ncbi:MAG: OB-fold domain-containing protein [Chloroflexi bacterium]|nr:OB-fold domain-containing protein [Chloroflexota bacterium]
MSDKTATNRIPVREGLFTMPLSPLEQVRLVGSRCRTCGEVGLGTNFSCQNCAGDDMEVIPLSPEGKLWTYTVIRNRPPGDYKGPDNPYLPLGEGLVELPEGIRVLSPLGNDVDNLEIGMDLRLKVYPLYENNDGNEVIAFKYEPV